MNIVLLLSGLAALVAGGDLLVRGAVALARRLRVPPLVIGLTLVGFGTSAPELVTSLQAALSGAPGIALGNVVGSNIGNVLLILGLAALLAPIAVDRRALLRDGTVLAMATAATLAVLVQGSVGRLAGAGLVAALVVYLAAVLVAERRRADGPETAATPDATGVAPLLPMARLTLAGLALTILGARLLVDGARGLAEAAGVSETLIGLTIVAIGTSAPELVTSVMAARKGAGDVAFGNILGSNIFNLTGILGLTALVVPLQVPVEILALDAWVMAGVTALLLVLAATGTRVSRGEGAVLLTGYAAYLGWLIATA